MADRFRQTSFALRIQFKKSNITYLNEVVSVSGTYALNSIPVAMAVIAAGREVTSGVPSQIHATLERLELREPVDIQVKIETNTPDSGIGQMRGQWCTIFSGYYAGSGYQRTHESANYTLQFVHWLDDLACSSALNGRWHPGVPHDYAQAAEGDITRGQEPSGNLSTFTCIVDPKGRIVNPTNIAEDLWGAVLKPLLVELASKPVGTQDLNDNSANNAAAIDALAKMPGDSPTPAKLALGVQKINDLALRLAFIGAITQILKNGISYSSFWSKLVAEFGAEFLFGVSPAATFANVIPYFGGLRREWRVIAGDDYNYANLSNSLMSLINSVEIKHAPGDSSGLVVGGAVVGSASYYRPLARYPSIADASVRGQIIVKDPPAWIVGTMPKALYSPLAGGVQGQAGDMGGQGATGSPPGLPALTELETELAGSAVVKNYAEHFYKSEVLAQRRGELSGKLRFDIAPGSIVKIEAADTDIIAPTQIPRLPPSVNFYAMVTQVSFVINAETHTAGTSFAVTSLRNENENENEILTAQTAPLYSDTDWVGGPLVKEAI